VLPQYPPLQDTFEIPPTTERFGVVEHPYDDTLGFGPDNYHSRQWGTQDERSRGIYLRTAARSHEPSRWCLGAYRVAGYPDYCMDPTGQTLVTSTGWVNETGLRQWVRSHPGKTYRIGNEPGCPEPCGDGLMLAEYAAWYYAAWQLVKSEDPMAAVGYGIPIGWAWEDSTLVNMWDAYRDYTGNPMPTDFHPIHRYAVHGAGGWTLEGETAFLSERMAFLDSHRGTDWIGRRYYILDEFGMLSWRYDVPAPQQMEYMSAMAGWLVTQDEIVTWSWWPSWFDGCSDTCGALIDRNGNVTPLGALYRELAAGE